MGIGDIILFFWVGLLIFFDCYLIRLPNISMADKRKIYKWLMITSIPLLIGVFLIWHGPLKRFFGTVLFCSAVVFNNWERSRFCASCQAYNYVTNSPWRLWLKVTGLTNKFPDSMNCRQCHLLIPLDDESLRLMSPW